MPSKNLVQVMDTTLRDGEQTPDVSYTPSEKLHLARLLLSDVKVDLGFKPLSHIAEHVLGRHEIDLDLAGFPKRLLRGDKPVRAAADQEPEFLSPSDHLDRDPAGGIAELERAVDVKADQVYQRSRSSVR